MVLSSTWSSVTKCRELVPGVVDEGADVDGHDVDAAGRVGVQGDDGPQPRGGVALGAGETEGRVQK